MTHNHISADHTDNQLKKLEVVCLSLEHTTKNKSKWVLYAVTEHIGRNIASLDFLELFNTLSDEQLSELVTYCLKGNDLSNNRLIKRAEDFIAKAHRTVPDTI